MILAARTVESPIGPLYVVANDRSVVGLEFGDAHARRDALARHFERWLGAHEIREAADPGGAATRLERYFAGERQALDEQPVAIHGTAFQSKVWNALREIPAGTTWTYTRLAEHIGQPDARRAVGAANGANPIALFVPCHRVIAADRTLWGYGGGLERKRWLLAHEGASFADPRSQGELTLGEV
jgi:methylated-DNA-[protein]-cysteine S-methyltransferase